MIGIYGWVGTGPRRVPLPPPHTACAPPPLPEPVYCDRSLLCVGCPYPRHGIFCSDKNDGGCLRADMLELEIKGRSEKELAVKPANK